jgi:hypothetical protein
LELSDDEDEMAFQEELFQHMDHPQSSDQPHKNLNYEVRGESQRNHQSLPHDTSTPNQDEVSVSNHFDSSLEHVQKSNCSSQLWRNQAEGMGLQRFQDGKTEPKNEHCSPFESFANQPVQSDCRPSSEKCTVSVFSKNCAQRGASSHHLSPNKKAADA